MNVRSGPAEQAKTVTQSLRTRFMFVMLGLAVVPLSLLPVLAGRNASISLEQQSVAFQRQVAAGVGSEIEAAIHGRLDDLEQLVLIAHLLDHSRQEQEVLLNSLLSHERMFQEIALIEADGDELVRVARDEAVLPSDLRSRSDDAAFERSLLTARPYFGPVAFDDDAREPLMTVAYPAVDLRSGRVSAVLVASVRFKPVWSLLAEQEMTAGRDVFVINAEGIVVGHRDPTRVLREEVYLPSGSASRSVGLDGTDSVVATVDLALGDQRLTVVAEQPLSTALQASTDAFIVTMYVTAFAAFLALAAIALATRRVIQPIERLAASAERVAAGDLTERVHATRLDEIGDLGRAFDHMTAELQRTVDELEDRVAARTFELEAAAAAQRSLITRLESQNDELAGVRDRLQELLRSKDEFLGSVSHELRTPLASVLGFASELRDNFDEFDPEERQQFVTLIAEQGEDMAHIIEDLLVAARADTDGLVVRNVPTDIGHSVASVLNQVTGVVNDVELENGVEALADPGRLRQILRNLVVNADRYGGDQVAIEVTERRGRVTLQVRDNGSGLPRDEWDAIFEPYTRSHHREGQPASVGLGLTVSRILARKMGGDLTYRHEGGSSVFELTLNSACADLVTG